MKKFVRITLFTLVLLAFASGTVFAQGITTTSISGEVKSVTLGTDSVTNEPNVTVTILDEQGVEQTVTLDLGTAATLGLIETDPVSGEPIIDPVTGEPIVAPGAVGSRVTINPTSEDEDEKEHPVGSAIADFFGVDYDTIIGYHEDGVGFGIIAQALWMTKSMDGDSDSISR